MLAPPMTTNYQLVGTAFDYLLRGVIERTNSCARRGCWVAQAALVFLPKRGALYKLAKKCYERAHAQFSFFHLTGEITDDLLAGAIQLAKLDLVYRIGPSYLSATDLEDIDSMDLADLRGLMRIIPVNEFRANRICHLNPTFGLGSQLVGGADADLILDDQIIDFKVTKNLKLRRDQFNQLFGYYTLWALNNRTDFGRVGPINSLGIYFARHGYLQRFNISELISRNEFPIFSKWFVEAACPSVRKRKRFLDSVTLKRQ